VSGENDHAIKVVRAPGPLQGHPGVPKRGLVSVGAGGQPVEGRSKSKGVLGPTESGVKTGGEGNQRATLSGGMTQSAGGGGRLRPSLVREMQRLELGGCYPSGPSGQEGKRDC